MQTQVTLTKHFPPKNGKGPNAFLTADDTRFKAWPDNPVTGELLNALNQAKSQGLAGVSVKLDYHIEENGQWVSNMIDGFEVVNDPAGQAAAVEVTTKRDEKDAAKQEVINRSAGLARAIEWFGVTGESLIKATDDGSFFELSDLFVEYIETGKFGAASPSSVGAVTEGAVA